MSILTTLAIPIWQEFEFRLQDTRLDRIEPAVVSFDFVAILHRLAMVAKHANLFCKGCIVCGNRPGFSTCAQVLTGIEAESSSMGDRTDTAPTTLLIGKVLGSVGLAGIFDD